MPTILAPLERSEDSFHPIPDLITPYGPNVIEHFIQRCYRSRVQVKNMTL